MRWVVRTLVVQVILLWSLALGYIYYDMAAGHKARLFAIAFQTIMHPRVKSPETDRWVIEVGRARLATELFGNWLEAHRLEIVKDGVLGAERYVAVYVHPCTSEVCEYNTMVRWQVMAERFHVDLEPYYGYDMATQETPP